MSDKKKIELKADKEGTLEKRGKQDKDKKKHQWKKYHFRLAGGALYYYANTKDSKAKGVFIIQGTTLKQEPDNAEKKFTIVLSDKTEEFAFATKTDAEFADWTKAITDNLNKEPVVYPVQGEKGIIFKAKKNLAGKVATSGVGKAAIKKVLDDEIRGLISSVKNIIAVETGSKETADRLEKNTIKMAVKCYFLWENGAITAKDIQKIEEPLKQSLRLLVTVFDHVEKVKDPELKKQILDEKFTVTAVLLEKVKEGLVSFISTHLTKNSVNRVNETFNIIARMEFFLKAYSDESLREDRTKVMTFVKQYIKNN